MIVLIKKIPDRIRISAKDDVGVIEFENFVLRVKPKFVKFKNFGKLIDFANDIEYEQFDDEYVQKLYDKLPIVLDIEGISSGEKYYLQPGFLNSYFNINCESFEQCDDWSYCSEKSFKPLISCQPFILVAGQNHLKTYRKWGYKTFHPFIDESYDDEPDYHIRMKMIENEILRLCSFTKKEIHEWYWSMNNILLHNLYNFKKSITIDAQERYKMIEDKWKNI